MDKNAPISQLPPPADTIVSVFYHTVSPLFGQSLTGIYCTGSIPLQDFYPNKSDIDLVVCLSILIKTKTKQKLSVIHKSIGHKFPNPALSVVYLSTDQNGTSESIIWRKGKFQKEKNIVNPLFLFELHTTGLTLFGKKIKDLNIQVTSKQVDEYLLQNINTYWASWLVDTPFDIRKQLKLFLFPRFTEWILLGMARQLYTLETGEITSKSQAGYYCMSRLPCDFEKILTTALATRHSKNKLPLFGSYTPSISLYRIKQTIKCGRYILDQFNNRYKEKYHTPGGMKLYK